MSVARRLAIQTVSELFDRGCSLSDSLQRPAYQALSDRDRALARALVYGVVRHWRLLNVLLDGLLDRPLKARDTGLRHTLVVGLYQLGWMRIPAHAAVNETVRLLRAPWARGLANAVMRRYQREGAVTDLPDAADPVRHSCPDWLAQRLAADWPEQLPDILLASNREAPMWLRVDPRKSSTAAYLEQLAQQGMAAEIQGPPHAVRLLDAVDVRRLPGFEQGVVSVQDAAAQHAAPLLAPRAGERLLDACAAPGGKSLHLLALAPDASLSCVEQDSARAARIRENLVRSGDQAQVLVADAAAPEDWWDGRAFDAILLDAPCSGTGVIRRHPDIKWLRRDSDIEQLAALQQQLLRSAWTLLRPGGRLLYATCSILKVENQATVSAFLEFTRDAVVEAITLPTGRAAGAGWQVLPGEGDMDGFYYALLRKA